ncbi:strumpellin and WASH-interacting protein [Dermatophagoides pteronyssinus]|uniref:strumpellin and WASH-interacting protein n=1 Tax=Dermatophagoides pteronyssinus TaxID=6956 RepID=UPI003F6771B9
MSTSSDLDQEIIDKLRHDTAKKYRNYIDELYSDIENLLDKFNFSESNSCFSSFNFFDEHRSFYARNENILIDEHTNFLELLQTCGNTQLNKLMLVFASLVEEMNKLSIIGIQKFIGPILLYREDNVINSAAKEAIVLDVKTDNGKINNKMIDEDDEFSAVAAILPILFNLICYVKRCYEVASNLFMQQHTFLLYANVKTKDKQFQISIREILPDLNENIRFDIVWESFSNLALTLINLDQIFSQQSSVIRRDIFNYKRSLATVLRDLPHYHLEHRENEIQSLMIIINEIERELLEGFIAGNSTTTTNKAFQSIDSMFFKGLIISIINLNISENDSILKNNYLNENMSTYIRNVCNQLEQQQQQNDEKFIDEYRLLSVTAFFSLYVHLFWKDSDKKLLKIIIDVQKKLNILFVHLPGNINISPDQVLLYTLPRQLADTRLFDHFVNQRELLMKPGFIEHQMKTLIPFITHWLVTIEQSFNSGFYNDIGEGDALNQIFNHIQLMKDGFEHIRQLSNLIKNCIAIHCQCNRPLSKIDTVALCKAIILLQGIKRFFANNKKLLIEIITHYQKYNACAILNILTRTKRKLLNNVTNYSEQKLDQLSSIILCANCLNGPVITSKRFILISLCFAYCTSNMDLFTVDDQTKIQILTQRISFFLNIFNIISQMFDCQYLYFNNEIIKVYFHHFYESFGSQSFNSNNINDLQYFFAAISDSIPLLRSIDDEIKTEKLINACLDDIVRMFKIKFLNPVCKDFEDELRFLSHLDLQLGDKNPFKRNYKDFSKLLQTEPLKIFNGRKIIWFKNYFENFLNELAYNMTTIALHDWKTYESMLGFAHSKFGLEFASLQLPTQTLEQGLDVLEITRNIHIFVAAYMYNLNNQFFVERNSSNKHLNVLTIRHIANSVQTHGFGILNSTVNFVYQFLRKKLQILSEFLCEEHIKSRLIKDIRHFRELMMANEEMNRVGNHSNKLIKFPFERADKFVKGIRKLGITKDNMTYLDKFRQLITQIGNVMGFVRMLRNGALHCTGEIANFIPDLDDLKQTLFEKMIEEEQSTEEEEFSDETIEAARNLDSVLKTIADNYSEATDYFKLLVEVFAPTFRNKKHVHLKNFYVILPATTLNYVEHIILCKEKLARKNKQEGAAFTDDGFAMGIIYILKLLDQLNDFDSLQWFASVDDYVRQSMPKLETEESSTTTTTTSIINRLQTQQSSSSASTSTSNDNVEQTRSLTIKRIEMFHREFQLLKFNMTSCRILFKSTNFQ